MSPQIEFIFDASHYGPFVCTRYVLEMIAMWFLLGLFLGWGMVANGRLVWPLIIPPLQFNPENWAKFKWLLLLITTLLSVWITLAADQGTIPQGVLVFRSFFLTTRFEVFIAGVALGAVININQKVLLQALREVFSKPRKAKPKSKPIGASYKPPGKASDASEKADDPVRTSWGLQGAAALVIVVLALVIARPEIFAYVRSFKFAGVEATFSERSAAVIKEADLHLEDLREGLTLREYKHFYRDYIHPASPRGVARTLFGPKDIEDKTGPIAELLMTGYFRPVITSITCLNDTHQLGSVAQDASLASFVYAWERILLSIHGTGTLSEDHSLVSENRDDRKKLIKENLARLRNSGLAVARRAKEIAGPCVEKDESPWKGNEVEQEHHLRTYNEPLKAFLDRHPDVKKDVNANDPEIIEDSEFIDKYYEKALRVLSEKHNDKPPIISLMVMDAYLVGATADLIALLSGQQKDKAIFLTNMLDQFPHSEEFITPGIINIFYQLSDARVRTLSSWTLQQTLADLDYSLHGADMLLSKSSEWLNARHELQPPDERCLKDPDKHIEKKTDKLTGEKLSSEKIAINIEIRRVWCVQDTYLRNVIIGLTTKLQLFNAMELSNRPISGTFRQDWRDSLGRMITLLKARLGTAIVAPSSVPPAPLDARKAALLPTIDVDADLLVEADLAATLSLILIDGRENSSDSLACNLSLYLMNDADRNARATSDELQPKDTARETRWRQLVAVHSQQIGRSCGWGESDSGTAQPKHAAASTE